MADELIELDAEVARKVFGFWFAKHPDGLMNEEEHWWARHSMNDGSWCYASVALPIRVQGASYRFGNGLPYFSSEQTAAQCVVLEMKSRPFSTRNRFIEALREEMPRPSGAMIDPSWWVFFMTPEMICRAALRAVESPSVCER